MRRFFVSFRRRFDVEHDRAIVPERPLRVTGRLIRIEADKVAPEARGLGDQVVIDSRGAIRALPSCDRDVRVGRDVKESHTHPLGVRLLQALAFWCRVHAHCSAGATGLIEEVNVNCRDTCDQGEEKL